MLYCLLLRRKTERIGLCHTQVPALTCLFALQSAKQISLPLENQVSRTCQRWVAHLKALEDHPQCDKRHETILWPPTTSESHNLNVKWLTVSVTLLRACGHGRGLMCLNTVYWIGKWCGFDVLKAQFIGKMIEMDGGVPLVRLSRLLNHSFFGL